MSEVFFRFPGVHHPTHMAKSHMTYAKAGVDMDAKSLAIASLVGQLKYRRKGRGRDMKVKGQFTSLIDFGDVALTLCTDGVGTKLLVAEALGKWDTVGIDCMAMNVNDTICVGAEPFAFVDYIALDKPDPKVAEQIGIGLNEGARLANVDLVGGEVAVLPEMVKGLDLSGTCLGFVDKNRYVDGSHVRVGDAIIGLPSSGIHSNGLSLARKVLKSNKIGLDERIPRLGKSVGMELLRPTTIYVRPVIKMLKKCEVTGMVDVTGGGLRNFVRLKKGVRFEIDDPLPPQPIFEILQELGGIEPKEMYQTFNMGMGFAIVCRDDESKSVVKTLGGGAKVIGHVTKGEGVCCEPLQLNFRTY
ncbi:MAG: phosphoribosylformylglycinamidine cyclo-ligase [Methanomassiliicoccales archaeon]|nr:phosphoribosylformylglycinamidine cyclo-ligase [Methanomassiliicoccales archaeon]